MKVDGALKSLLQGVSQQPPRERLAGQCTLQLNMSSDPVIGLTRRAPTDLVGYLGSTSSPRGWHNFETRDGEKYIAFFHDSTVSVFDLNANAKTSSVTTSAAAYIGLNGALRFNTDETDETVLVNRAALPAMTSAVATYYNTDANPAGIIQILGGQYGRNTSIAIDGVTVATYRAPSGDALVETAWVTTTFIAEVLAWLLVHPDTDARDGTWPTVSAGETSYTSTGALADPAVWTVTRVEDIILIRNLTGTSFSLTVNDDFGNVNVKAMTKTVPDVADLPRMAPHLYVVRVAQKTDPDQDLWFKFIVDDSSASDVPDDTVFGNSGYWQECVAPGVATDIDLATMPHIMSYNPAPGVGEFNFECAHAEWVSRHVGTLLSNPNPSFIGQHIQDVSSFQGRTVFLAGSSAIMSRTNKPKDFWMGSASALADSDPIDIKSRVEASTLLSAVQHNRDLAIFSPKGQFVIFGRDALTPKNAALVLTTKFEAELNAQPASAGRNVFFASNFGRYTGVREFFAEGGTDMNDSRPITQHVKSYILGKVTLMSSTANYDTLLVHTDADLNNTYCYQYIWSDTEKVQAAWSVWQHAHKIVHSFFDEDVVYLVQQVDTEFYLLRMDLDVQDSAGMEYPIYLDQRFDVTDCFQAFNLPYDYLRLDELICVQGEGCPVPGTRALIDNITLVDGSYVVTLKRDLGGGNLVVGVPYRSAYRPTMPDVKDGDGTVVGNAKLHIRNFLVALSKTGEIVGQLLSKFGNGPEVRFNGRIVGFIEDTVGGQPLSDETFVMPFRQSNKEAEVEFSTSSHLPMTLIGIEWAGQYNKRGRRITNGGGK